MQPKIIILDELQFDFTETQLAKFITYWNEYSKHSNNTVEIVKQIAKDLRFPVDNTFFSNTTPQKKRNDLDDK